MVVYSDSERSISYARNAVQLTRKTIPESSEDNASEQIVGLLTAAPPRPSCALPCFQILHFACRPLHCLHSLRPPHHEKQSTARGRRDPP
jgi:hypothetical protein